MSFQLRNQCINETILTGLLHLHLVHLGAKNEQYFKDYMDNLFITNIHF